MEKTKYFDRTRFTAEVLREATAELVRLQAEEASSVSYLYLSVEHNDSEWKYDDLEEFLADYRIYRNNAILSVSAGKGALVAYVFPSYARIIVKAESRSIIESIFGVFEAARDKCTLPEPLQKRKSPVVFIGHGRSRQWRDLKDHLQEKHDYKIETYETGARAGHSIRDILEEMIDKSSFAVLVMTAEDEQAEGSFRARQNVVHEAGLFQGRLGFPRAIMLLEDGLEEFSNVQGVQYIRFSKENIKETYGEVLATIRREFHK